MHAGPSRNLTTFGCYFVDRTWWVAWRDVEVMVSRNVDYRYASEAFRSPFEGAGQRDIDIAGQNHDVEIRWRRYCRIKSSLGMGAIQRVSPEFLVEIRKKPYAMRV